MLIRVPGLTLWRPVGRRGAREARDVEFLHQIGPGWGVLFLHHILTPTEILSKSFSFIRLTEFLHQKWQLSRTSVYVGVILLCGNNGKY